MKVDDVIDEIISDLAAGLIDKSDEEIEAQLDSYDLDDEDRQAVMELVEATRAADTLADKEAEKNPLSIEKVDEMADADAAAAKGQDMSNEDDTKTVVTEEDVDGDGDADKVTIEKEEPEDDGLPFSYEDDTADADTSSNDEDSDKPHDFENMTNEFANILKDYRR